MARARRAGKRQPNRSLAYIDGNTVRELEPYEIPRQVQREKRRQAERANAVKRNRQRQLVIDAGYMLFLTAAVIITLLVCMNFLYLKAQVQSVNSRLTSAKEEVMDLRVKNDAAYNRILTSIDLEEIRRKATEELGMVPAGKEQIVRYDSNQDDYMMGHRSVSR
ncbi:MAG: hypothetical protein IK152_01955 [Lachnospiraceae bacterium]|nr:hypothetical protein [Lachnospiraceae bacterium]